MAYARGAMAPDPRGTGVYRLPDESGRRARQICKLDRPTPTRNQSSTYRDGLRETPADRVATGPEASPPERCATQGFWTARFLRKRVRERAVRNLVGSTARTTGKCHGGCSLYRHLTKDRD